MKDTHKHTHFTKSTENQILEIVSMKIILSDFDLDRQIVPNLKKPNGFQ